MLADELTHVRFGSNWVKEFTKGRPEKARAVKEFQMETERAFSFGGQQPLAHQDRIEAGFTEEELREIEDAMSRDRVGPRRETLHKAAEILRDRHQARRRGDSVPPLEALTA